MIPLRLTLKNFMSYREGSAAIDFAPLHTACLSGDNGAGKSALLTALTWALWGEVPAHTEDEDLITQGETEMAVDFEFGLGEQQYRVLRTRSRKGKTSKGSLFFQIRDPILGWRDISDDNARQTQRTITGRLHMDYETFVNSAFLRQGRADEFTTKGPRDRKEILARILGLDQYDRLAEQARETARSREQDRRGLALGIAELDRQIAQKPALTQQAAEVAAFLATARQALASATSEASRLTVVVAAAEKDKLDLDNVRARAAQDEVEITKAERAISQLDTNLARYQETLAQRDSITRHYERLQSLRGQQRALSDRARQSREIDSEVHRLERVIDAGRNALTTEIMLLGRTIAEQRREAEKQAGIAADLAVLRTQLAALTAADAAWQAAKVSLEDLQQHVAGLQGANDELKEEADGLHAKLKLLDEGVAAAEAGRRGGAEPCPLCGILLDPSALERVRASFNTDIAVRRRQWKANTRETESLHTQIGALQPRLQELEQTLKGRTMAERREATLDRDLQAALDAAGRAARDETRLQGLRARLAASDYANEERLALQEVQARQIALGYDAAAHHRVEQECHQLEIYEARHADLRSAEEKLALGTERRERERETLAAHRARLERARADIRRLEAAVADLLQLRQQLVEQRSTLRYEEQRFDTLSREQAAKERELEAVAAAETAREIRVAELRQATTEKGIYEDLARAFGKAGIQAMIIEQVTPELADDANALLARMTDSGMRLSFETQKQAKSTDTTIETLDIKITDGAGVARKYEMFSGGEAFRINFAVRIALSKLLARRAGAQLQTLIIDEGFGTQDAQGRERLIQAIRSIQKDFEKILVITHIDELKDEFAARIDVVKTAQGSEAVVN